MRPIFFIFLNLCISSTKGQIKPVQLQANFWVKIHFKLEPVDSIGVLLFLLNPMDM